MFLKLELLLSLEVTLAEKPQMKINKKTDIILDQKKLLRLAL